MRKLNSNEKLIDGVIVFYEHPYVLYEITMEMYTNNKDFQDWKENNKLMLYFYQDKALKNYMKKVSLIKIKEKIKWLNSEGEEADEG